MWTMWDERSFDNLDLRAECAELVEFCLSIGRPELAPSMIREGVTAASARRLVAGRRTPQLPAEPMSTHHAAALEK